jgi:hypothetical protein
MVDSVGFVVPAARGLPDQPREIRSERHEA